LFFVVERMCGQSLHDETCCGVRVGLPPIFDSDGSVFSGELVLKIAGREVDLDKSAETLLARSLEVVKRDIETLWVPREPLPVPKLEVRGAPQPCAVGIDRAARDPA
jgi:hypothetical protein